MNLLRQEEVDEFRGVLMKIRDEIKQLLELENKKFVALKNVDVEELLKLNSSEEEHLSLMEEYDRQRQNLMASFIDYHGFKSGLTLKELAEFFPETERSELVRLGDDIRHDTDRLDLTVRENEALIHANMEIIQMTLSYAGQEEKIGYGQSEPPYYSESLSGLSGMSMVNHIA